MPGIMDLISAAMAGGGPGGPGGPPAASPAMMPPGPPTPMGAPGMGPGGMPEIPAGGSAEMSQQLEAAADQVLSIGSRVYAQGNHDAAIAIARAGKELRKASEKLRQSQPMGAPPAMGGPPGTMGGVGMGPPPLPGMG